MTLEDIKNKYAVSQGYPDYETMLDIIIDACSLSLAVDVVIEHTDEVMKIYAKECLILAAENATMKVLYREECYQDSNEYGQTYVDANDVDCGGEGGYITIEEESITNDKNIIL